ncbi:LytTR family DNA-binding domain-containing protein [Algibacter mikhailovii]|uniref:HTH LytTR-type domain-containing protein n=1 Tax=Algibacter mikhailovii TaxID=425498 RepID=A0A918VBS0_9FLAO|nr:LytTR family DNA-binding domain-containing protein [Algibacter mikhailovii]GGZ89396.1 hypothetical protein GCM10007028_29580 [Algibacter mikhailovii]
MKIRTFLNQSFDFLSSAKNKWRYISISTGFVLVFLLLFQPYGLSEEVSSPVNPIINIILFFASIVLNTFVTLSVTQFYGRKLLQFENVTYQRYMLWFFIETLALTLVNFALSFIIPDLGNDFEEELNFGFQLKVYFKTMVVLLFPFMATIAFILIKNLNDEILELGDQLKNYQSTFRDKQKSELLEIKDENDNIDFSLALINFLYVEASNQYILIHYLKDGCVKKHITRNRMKSFLNQTQNLPITQCHRSYAVNLLNVNHKAKIKGKDYLVNATIDALKVPISKSYLHIINTEVLPRT